MDVVTDTDKANPCAEVQSRGLADGPDSGRTLYGSGRATIYGDYVAPAISSPSTASPWHIDAEHPGQPSLTLCGKTLTGYVSRMSLHVSLLECSTCMKMGGERPSRTPATVEDDADCWCGADGGEGCYCCTDDCPEDCSADHKGEQ